jgi:putative MATE family efflux protein
MLIFNLTDTYFVGQLGKDQLAAITFTFPVVMFFVSLALGLGMGTSAVVSRAIGEGNREKVVRLASDSLLLILLIALIAVAIGVSTMDELFTMLGAEGHILEYVKSYMLIWYSGVIFVMIPMVGNNAIRATGDTKTPSLIMLIAAGVNIILDPLLIFGYGPVPAMGIEGAAYATLISRSVTLLAALYILVIREKMVSFKPAPLGKVKDSFQQVLQIGLPTAITRVLMPVGIGVITKMVSSYGIAAVAAFGVGSRIDMLSMTPLMALASVAGPFVGQNAGAKFYDRIKKAVKGMYQFIFAYGIISYIVIAALASYIVSIFNEDPHVIQIGADLLRITPANLPFMGLIVISSVALNVLRKPIKAGVLGITQMFVLYIPMAWLFSEWIGLNGIFYALVISGSLIGIIATFITMKEIKIQGNLK